MGRLSIEELSAVLSDKNGLSKQDAQKFVSAIFDLIQEGIERDRLVKVKGLGTFKVIGVDARESVNVNTGERVLIDSHSKISFIPDATMKELVNKPFSSFETVVLNEGVEFDDMPGGQEPETATTLEDDASDMIDEPNVTEEEKEEPVLTTDVIVEESEQEAEVQMETPEPESKPEVEPVAVTESVHEKEPVPVTEGKKDTKFNWKSQINNIIDMKKKPWNLIVACLLIGFCLGYFAKGIYEEKTRKVQTVEVFYPGDSLFDTLYVVATVPSSGKSVADTSNTVKKEVTGTEEDTVKSVQAAPKETPTAVNDYLKYEEMDARVLHGAYYIVGTDCEVKAKEGETAERISRRYLGQGMSCYVEVYNGVNANTPLEEGQVIKIPKLVTKKSMKDKLSNENKTK